jgi:hypothetical protein
VLVNIIKGMTDEIKGKIAIQLMQHRQKHIAYLYGEETGVLSGKGTNQSMDDIGSNQMAFGQLMGAIPGGGVENSHIGQGAAPTGATGSPGLDTGSSGILGITSQAAKG